MEITTKKCIEIRYGETDQMGVVYHGSYPAFLEIGRIDWLKQLGFSYAKMEKDNCILPVILISIQYKKSLFFGESLLLHTTLNKAPKVKITFNYELYNAKQECVGLAETTLAFINKQTHKPMACPAPLLAAINARMA